MTSHDSMMSIPSEEIFPFNKLSFRKTVLFYLKTNAYPRTSLKLMQISRYFCYREFPYMVVYDLRYDLGQLKYFQFAKSKNIYQILNLNNLTKPLWISNKLFNSNSCPLISQLLSKTAVCDIKKLYLAFGRLKIKEFKFLISSNVVEDISFNGTQVVYEDENIVPFEEIIKLLPKLKNISWTFTDAASEINPSSTAKVIENLSPSVLTKCSLTEIPETFDFELFAKFMDKNPTIEFILCFKVHLFDAYKKILQTYVDKLIKTGDYKNRKIVIDFQQQNPEFFNILQEHYWIN